MIPYFAFEYFYLGPVKINIWGLLVGLAFSVAYLLILYQAKRKGIFPEKIIGLAIIVFAGAIFGSRLFFLLQSPAKFLADVSLLWRIDFGGLMLWGGILGGILFGWIYVKKVKLKFWELADFAAPAIALGIGIGRIGCFLINDHLGAPTNLSWGILWPDGILRHPVALYESLAGFGLFVIFWLLQRRLSRRGPASGGAAHNVIPAKAGIQNSWIPGQARDDKKTGRLFLLFLISYSFLRFFLDFLRASEGPLADPHWWGLTSSQWISIIIFIFALSVLQKCRFFCGKKAA